MARSTNLQAIIDACHNSTIPNAGVIRVISNREKAYGLERAKRASRLSQKYHHAQMYADRRPKIFQLRTSIS